MNERKREATRAAQIENAKKAKKEEEARILQEKEAKEERESKLLQTNIHTMTTKLLKLPIKNFILMVTIKGYKN